MRGVFLALSKLFEMNAVMIITMQYNNEKFEKKVDLQWTNSKGEKIFLFYIDM